MATPCKCGRSPTGQCIGWHMMSQSEFLKKLREHERTKLKEGIKRKKEKNDPPAP